MNSEYDLIQQDNLMRDLAEYNSLTEYEMPECKRSFKLLGGTITIGIYDIDQILLDGLFEELYKEGLRLEKIFNFFDSTSELSMLNKNRVLKVSEELLTVIKKGSGYAEMTDGAYDITLGKNIMNRKRNLELVKLGCSYKDIIIKGNIVALNHPDILIDLGSIAKGYIADMIIEYMKKLGIENGFIDARGDLRIFGKALEIVQVQHPRIEEKGLRKIIFKNMSIATSGDYKQYYGSYEKSHIIGNKDVISVTVVADELVDADALATCLFVIGLENIEKLMDGRNASAYVIDKDLKEYYFNGFQNLIIDENKLMQ